MTLLSLVMAWTWLPITSPEFPFRAFGSLLLLRRTSSSVLLLKPVSITSLRFPSSYFSLTLYLDMITVGWDRRDRPRANSDETRPSISNDQRRCKADAAFSGGLHPAESTFAIGWPWSRETNRIHLSSTRIGTTLVFIYLDLSNRSEILDLW